jgi:hypothetical protein
MVTPCRKMFPSPPYEMGIEPGKTDYLDSLGPLIKPTRGSRAERALPPERVAQSSEPAIVPASTADVGFPPPLRRQCRCCTPTSDPHAWRRDRLAACRI